MNWWENIGNWLGNLGSKGNVGYAPQYETPRVIGPQYMPTSGNSQYLPYSNTTLRPASSPRLSAASAGPAGKSTIIPPRLEAAGRMGGANAIPQQPMGRQGMSDEELLAWLLGGAGGGGAPAPDLSGFQEMIGDVNKRRDQLNIRKWQQRKFLDDLFAAADARATSDRDALAGAIESQLQADAARRATEIGLIRGEDAPRLETSNAAREALGVAPVESDLTSEVAQNAVAGVGAGGSVADRDARINQAIQSQQYAAEIAGLTPMRQMATGELMRNYEDRLAALSSERAAIKAQMAQAKAAPRGGSSGPSVSEKLAALNFIEGRNQAPQGPAAMGGQAVLNSFIQNDPRNSSRYGSIYNSIAPLLSSYAVNPVTGKYYDATELANVITRDNPNLVRSGSDRDFLQQLVKDFLKN